jgi:hypothetical protein
MLDGRSLVTAPRTHVVAVDSFVGGRRVKLKLTGKFLC